MPFSDYRHIPTVLHYVFTLRPRSVLDVGVGMGAYGFLLRQFLDLDESLDWMRRRLRVEGIEIFEPYRNPVWDFAYDRVHVGDARAILPTLGSYDVILMNDVLEHFGRAEARALVREALSHSRAVIATTPRRKSVQGAWAGNEAETHRSRLDASDFASLVVEVPIAATTCFVCATDREVAARLRAATPFCPVASVALMPRLKRRVLRVLPGAKRRAIHAWQNLAARLRDRRA